MGCSGSSDPAPTSLCVGYPPVSPHACGRARGSCGGGSGLTLSAALQMSPHQVNCPSAQSLEGNVQAVAGRRRAISPRPAKGNSGCPSGGKMDFPSLGQRREGAVVTVAVG